MEGENRGAFAEWHVDVVTLGRLAGVLVLLSALGLAIWFAVDTGFPGDVFSFRFRMQRFWSTLVGMGWGGVALILLAEIADRQGGPGETER